MTVEPETMLEDAVELMFRHRFKKLPVVERNGVGINLARAICYVVVR